MSEKNGNWWEFYGIRYAQGAVVGAMLIYLLFSQNATLKKVIFVPDRAADLSMAHLALLGVYGLAYCYIASAPILIMHAARGLLYKSRLNRMPSTGWQYRLLFVLVTTLSLLAIYFTFVNQEFMKLMAVGLFGFLISVQLILIGEIFFLSWDKVIGYYELTVARRNDPMNLEFVESYKHIREHGNSFLIVLFQFLLAVPIFVLVVLERDAERSIANFLIIILFWIFPASLIWLFGNKLENHLELR